MSYPMTPRGLARLKEELRACKAERPKLADVILAARELGDLSENAEYHAAKEKQGLLEARIRELESKVAQADVIDPAMLSGDRVAFGASVLLEDEEGVEVRYQLVGEDEANAKEGMISISSPVARALLKHEVGDEVTIKVPGGTRVYEIVDVSFG